MADKVYTDLQHSTDAYVAMWTKPLVLLGLECIQNLSMSQFFFHKCAYWTFASAMVYAWLFCKCNGHVMSNEQILHILDCWNGWQSLQRWATAQQRCLCCNVDQTLSFIGVGVHTEPKNVSVLFPHMCTLSLFCCNGLCLIILQMQQGHVTRNGRSYTRVLTPVRDFRFLCTSLLL
jgi:hypothetical protein